MICQCCNKRMIRVVEHYCQNAECKEACPSIEWREEDDL